MASLTERIRRFLATPRGQAMLDRGRRELANPATQQRLRRLLARLGGRR